jgi:Zn-dependent protease with chaperone function
MSTRSIVTRCVKVGQYGYCSASVLLGVLALAALSGCAGSPPKPPPATPAIAPREANDDERFKVSAALAPLLRTSGMWRGPEDGCAVALGVLPRSNINMGVGPHPACRFSLLVTEGALQRLPPEEMRAALSHELGHVELEHLGARRARRQAERGAMMQRGAQAAAFRAYDRDEERAADRWAADLLNRLPGDGTRCHALVALLRRLEREGQRPEYFNWLSTHPSPVARLQALTEVCP